MEQKKLRPYLLYAIGEIALVMIGILLALQVNNWNEVRKEKIRAVAYKESLIKDLQQDSVSMKEVLLTINYDQEEFGRLQQRLTDSDATLDTAYQIARNEVNLFADRIRPFNNNSLTTLSSTGDINLLSDSIVEQLLTLRRTQQLALELGELTYETFWSAASEFSYALPGKTDDSFSLIDRGALNDLLWERTSKIEILVLLNKSISAKQNHYRIAKFILTDIQQKTHELLSELRKSLE